MQIEINSKVIQLSEAGWMEDLSEWDEEIAVAIARNEKVEMTPEHWDIVYTAREYFEENGAVAEPRIFSKIMKEKFGVARSSSKYIYDLFPYGLIKSANKVAGLPRPKGCS
jgi:tRNA 2-thiouridine synthesizing protein E